MSSDVSRLWNYICDYADDSLEMMYVFTMKELIEAGLTGAKVKRQLAELKEKNLLKSYFIDEQNEEIGVELKKQSENGKSEEGNREGENDDQGARAAKEIDGLYHINKQFMDELQESSHLPVAKLQYYRLSGNIRDILYVAGRGIVIAYDELLQCIISGINQKIYFGDNDDEDEDAGALNTRVFFITGNGGVGKTTLLAMSALNIAENTDTDVYIAQIRVNISKDFAKRVMDEVSRSKDAMLFIDNPYDNLDVTKYLIDCVREKENIRIVFSERLNRLELIFKDAALIPMANIAGAVVITNQKQRNGSNQESSNLKFVRRENTKEFELAETWKREVVERMISYILPKNMKLEDERLQNILRRTSYTASPCEMLLQVCLQYNREVENESLETKIPFQFDWDEWKRMFSASAEYAIKTEGLSLENVFPFIAALGLYKISVTVGFIANLVRVNELELKKYFDEKLNGTEPVCYDGELLSLKHDMIADLYFQAHERERAPQYYLMEALKYLDESLIIEYERYVLSAKIIRGKREIPHASIDTVALLKKFEQHEQYIRCLKDHDRFYSYRYAKIIITTQENNSNEEEFQNEWSSLLQETSDDEKVQIIIWTNCFITCMERNFFPPDNFFSIIDYVNYRTVTMNMSNFENYVRNRECDIFLYRQIARKTYQAIACRYEGDIPSRLALVETMVKQDAIEEAENFLKTTLELDIEDKYILCVEYGTLCKKQYAKFNRKFWKMGPEEKRQNPSIYRKRKYYLENAEKYYRLAVELSQGDEKARPLCALAGFLQNTAGANGDDREKSDRIQEAKKYYLEAIEIGGNDYSAYNGLAMIYAYVQKWNLCYNPAEADRCFKKAIEDCPKKRLVSHYVPWGNFNYNIGNLETAIDKYRNALKYKPGEIKAIKGIELINEEQCSLAQLLQEEPIKVKNFKRLYCYKKVKRNNGKNKRSSQDSQQSRVLNKDLFKDEKAQREILRLVYSTLLSEKITQETLKRCKKMMTNLSHIGDVNAGTDDEKKLLYLRIAQRLQRCCLQYGEAPYLDLEKEKEYAHMTVVRYKKALG